MKQIIVSIRDAAADAYGRPAFVPTKAMAIRSFADEVNRPAPDNMLNAHPSSFALFELGVYDDSTGGLESHPAPVLLIQADQCLKP